jgi:hypothetical protein
LFEVLGALVVGLLFVLTGFRISPFQPHKVIDTFSLIYFAFQSPERKVITIDTYSFLSFLTVSFLLCLYFYIYLFLKNDTDDEVDNYDDEEFAKEPPGTSTFAQNSGYRTYT